MLECFRKKTVNVIDSNGEIKEMVFLEPSNQEAQELLSQKLDELKTYQFEIKENRNYDFLKKYMKLIRFCHANMPERLGKFLTTFEQTRMALEFEINNLDYYWTLPTSSEIFNSETFLSLFSEKYEYDKEYISKMLELSYDTIIAPQMHSAHKSIAFDKMSHAEFEELYKRMFDAVSSILSVSPDSVFAELQTFA